MNDEPKPFLRWAGGKRALVGLIRPLLPRDVARLPYHEPFLGAGSLFFEIQPQKAWLSDANESLIDTYGWLREDARSVLRCLSRHAKRHSPSHYYETRNLYNRSENSAAKAAAFIYLNKACYNGIFRVNRSGEFNVPVGSKTIISVPTRQEIESIGAALRRATLKPQDFTVALQRAKAGHFVYLDPPYPALNETAYFNHYTVDRFGNDQQVTLAAQVSALHNRGCKFLMTNADVPLIRDLYSDFRILPTPVMRFISCKSNRQRVGELVITNYAEQQT